MAFKPNYNQQRRDRERVKEQKKQEKLLRRKEAADQRKVERGDLPDTDGGSEDTRQ